MTFDLDALIQQTQTAKLDGTLGTAEDAKIRDALLRRIAEQAPLFQLFQIVRLLQLANPDAARVGYQGPVHRETVRFRPSLSFGFPSSDVERVGPIAPSPLWPDDEEEEIEVEDPDADPSDPSTDLAPSGEPITPPSEDASDQPIALKPEPPASREFEVTVKHIVAEPAQPPTPPPSDTDVAVTPTATPETVLPPEPPSLETSAPAVVESQSSPAASQSAVSGTPPIITESATPSLAPPTNETVLLPPVDEVSQPVTGIIEVPPPPAAESSAESHAAVPDAAPPHESVSSVSTADVPDEVSEVAEVVDEVADVVDEVADVVDLPEPDVLAASVNEQKSEPSPPPEPPPSEPPTQPQAPSFTLSQLIAGTIQAETQVQADTTVTASTSASEKVVEAPSGSTTPMPAVEPPAMSMEPFAPPTSPLNVTEVTVSRTTAIAEPVPLRVSGTTSVVEIPPKPKRLKKIKRKKPPVSRYLVETTFLGLYGSSSPLPTFFTEDLLGIDSGGARSKKQPDGTVVKQRMIEDHPEDGIVRAFLDIFHHRALSLLFRCWEKYRIGAYYKTDGSDYFSKRILTMLGLGPDARPPGVIPIGRLLGWAAALAHQPCSPATLGGLLNDAFEDCEIVVESFVGRWIDIPNDQKLRLGANNGRLGQSAMLGGRIFDASGTFRVTLKKVPREHVMEFMPGRPRMTQLREIIDLCNRDGLDHEVEVVILTSDLPRPQLGASTTQLGWSTFLGIPRTPSVTVRFLSKGWLHRGPS